MGMLTSILYLTSVIVALPSGIWVDRMGARKWLIISLLLMGVPFAIMSLCHDYTSILVLSAISGMGYGILNQVSVKGLMYWFSSSSRATALGIKQSGVAIGGALNGIILVALASAFHWHMAVLLIGALCLILSIISFFLYRERPPQAHTSTVFSTSAAGKETPPGKTEGLKAVLANPVLLVTLAVMPLMAGGQAGFAAHWALFLEEDLLLSRTLAGTCFMAAMIISAVARIGWGVVSDRLLHGDRIKTMIIISITALLGATIAFFLHSGIPSWVVFLSASLIGIGFLGWHGVMMALMAEVAGARLAGSITGVGITVLWIGMVLAPLIFGTISDHWGYIWCWALMSISAIISVIAFSTFSLRSKKHPGDSARTPCPPTTTTASHNP
jgi:sugar phosphate permease